LPQPLQHDLLCWAEAQAVLAFVLRDDHFRRFLQDSSSSHAAVQRLCSLAQRCGCPDVAHYEPLVDETELGAIRAHSENASKLIRLLSTSPHPFAASPRASTRLQTYHSDEGAMPTRVRTITIRFRASVVKHELCWDSMLTPDRVKR